MQARASLAQLENERSRFRSQAGSGNLDILRRFDGRVAVVLSGGGARGAFEAGVLMAFQDAGLPTHILSATSVGSINAASYAAHSNTLVGSAESLVESWSQVTPPAMGIDWSRYIFMLAGLVAAMAGLGNFLWLWLKSKGIYLHSDSPDRVMFAWLSLMLAGIAILVFFDKLSYSYYITKNIFRRRRWKTDRKKAVESIFANALVWGFAWIFLSSTHLHVLSQKELRFELGTQFLVLGLALLGVGLWLVLRHKVSMWSHKFLRMPLRTGLFANYERTKFLRSRIPLNGLRNSPMRVVMTATDIMAGKARYFTNTSLEVLQRDPQVNRGFVAAEMEQAADLMQAIIASSAFTIAYEAVPIQGRLLTDGGIVTNQPIRPAVRLGADVLFLVMVSPEASPPLEEVKTFLDVGVRAIDILIAKNLNADLKLLARINELCEIHAAGVRLRPEQVEVHLLDQRYRYVKPITVCPSQPLPATALDFEASVTVPAIVEGYREGTRAALQFAAYVAGLPPVRTRHIIKLVPEAAAARASS
jgi:predicted acylesterase/phospholipase RssA